VSDRIDPCFNNSPQGPPFTQPLPIPGSRSRAGSVHVTGEHVYRGLAGFYIMQDDVEDVLRLPGSPLADPGRGYGHFDIPLMIKDVMIAPQEIDDRPAGTLIYNNCGHFGAFGDIMTVNGKQQTALRCGEPQVSLPVAERL
jgi:FtsP/CotA-like multicopper oxidase with cupredoxin domain